MKERHIVAMGGGGFSDDDPLLDDFVLSLVDSAHPRACFVPTASGDSDTYVSRFRGAFSARGCEVSDLALFDRTVPDLREFLLSQDVIYVGGGNTANMLAVWRVQGVASVLREAWAQGIVLAGVSAGAMCWFECGVTDSFGRDTSHPLYELLGFLSGSFTPHFDTFPDRREAFHDLIAKGFPGGYGVDEFAAAHFVGTELAECVASRDGAAVHRITAGSDGVEHETLPTRLLSV